MDSRLRELLTGYAARYETASFLNGDPSWFMHQVAGAANREAMAFLASGLSYGSRKQFMPKINWLLQQSGGAVDAWVREGRFEKALPADNGACYYRLFTVGDMRTFLRSYRVMMLQNDTLGCYLQTKANARSAKLTALEAVEAITSWFATHDSGGVVPVGTQSACKRICMFLRWMVRQDSPVDLGLWADFIDRRSLIIPLDTHVLAQACRLGLLRSRTASMSAALKLTAALSELFPLDPLRGDFALFGYGVNVSK